VAERGAYHKTPGYSHLKACAGELRAAVVAESPERVERVLIGGQAVTEVRAGERPT